MKAAPSSFPAESPPSFWRRLLHGFRKLRQQPDWQSYVGADWPARIMTEEVTDRFHAKQGRSIGRWTLTNTAGRSLVVYLKRHYQLPRMLGWLATLFPGRAWSPGLQEWEHLAWAERAGLPVPRAVAAGEFVDPGGKLQSFLAIEELTGMLPLHEAIPLAESRLDARAFVRWKKSLVREVARVTRLMHDKKVYHKDLYLCHFYILEDDTKNRPESWTDRVFVIDLHRLGHHSVTAIWWRIKDLAQLLYSSEISGVAARDRLAFWRAYTPQSERGLLARLVRWKWRLYRGHNQKRTKSTPIV